QCCAFAGRRRVHCFPTRRSSDLATDSATNSAITRSPATAYGDPVDPCPWVSVNRPGAIPTRLVPIRRARAEAAVADVGVASAVRSEEHTSELQSLRHLVCRLLPE